MPDPAPYIVSYSFSGFQANNPTTPLPAGPVDNEFANIAAAVATLVSAMEDVRRSDGALQNGIVTYDSLASSLQLTFDPTNGQAVAAAVALAQAAQVASAASAATATTEAGIATTQAAAAAASAGSVNLSLYFPKTGNLAGVGNPDTARANLNGAKVDGSDMTGRLAPLAITVADWNNAITNGWYCATGAANGPDSSSSWLAQVFAYNSTSIAQIAYSVSNAPNGTSAVTIFRRHSYSNAGVLTWQAWESAGPVPIGSTIWINGTTAPPGFLKENGALVLRANFPALTAYALASGNIVSEATWSSTSFGSFSTGDLATTIRLPDSRAQFIRAWDDGLGTDSGRVIGTHQTADNQSHTHAVTGGVIGSNSGTPVGVGTGASIGLQNPTAITISSQGTEGRPRNNAKLACIKY